MYPDARPQWLGRLGYRWAWQLQQDRRQAVIAGRAPEAFWLLEHPAVITLGRRGGAVLPLARDPVVRVERGGLATWHGPGQLVGYLILDLGSRGVGIRATVHAIEQGLIDWLGGHGVVAVRRAGFPGVWCDGAKIGAVGLHVRRSVTMHGFALNIHNDLSRFDQIVPCGIADGGVTSLQHQVGGAPALHDIASSVGRCVLDCVGTIGQPDRA